ncbi:MAG: DUF2934 domain-containing protein [Gammaproteobacteria bacterium]|nr:DUF2934 domain-containing protein [Gammaproteobacteria bacterium]
MINEEKPTPVVKKTSIKKKSVAKKSVAAKADAPAASATVVTNEAPAKKVASKKSGTTIKRKLTPEERHHYIAEAAYHLACSREFNGGNQEEDWFTAAHIIDSIYETDYN